MLDSREYEWADLTLILGGNDITGFRGIKIKEKIEREAIYAKGRQPHSIQSGNASYEGEIMLLGSEYEALVKAGKGTVMSLALDGILTMGNPAAGDALISKRAVGIRFTEASSEWKQGDKFQEITLPFICLNLKNEE